MPQMALGNVQPASTTTALQATNNFPALLNQPVSTSFRVQSIQFQALAGNTSSVYIVDRQTPNLTLNVFAEIPAPSASPPARPVWVIGDPTKSASFDLAQYWILPAVSGEGVRVTVVRS